MKASGWIVVVAVVVIVVVIAIRGIPRWTRHPRLDADERPAVDLVSAESAARRALCLGTIMARAAIFEEGIKASQKASPEMQKTMHEALWTDFGKINERLREEGLWSSLSPNERTLMSKPLGGWTDQELLDAEWRAEALCAIEWALGIVKKMPAYDSQLKPTELTRNLSLDGDTAAFVRKSHLRSPEEISDARDMAELWLWRARTTQLQKRGDKPPANLTYEKIIAIAAEGSAKEGYFKPIDGDFPAFGQAYSKLTDDEWSMMCSIATERLYALNWLCGYDRDWDKIHTDT